MAALMAACVVTTGCFRDTFRNCSLFRGDECGQPARGGLCDWNWFGTRDRYQPVVTGYGSCSCTTCTSCVGCEGGYTAYSPGMEVVDGGVYYEGMDGSFSDGSIISEGEIIESSPSGTIVLPGPAN